jgi:hypothetical protein
MKKIEKLPTEIESRLSEYRDEWIRTGLSCEPADRKAAEAAADHAYAVAGLEAPSLKIWLGSPLAGCIASSFFATKQPQVRDQVGAQVGAQVVDQVWDQAWDQVGAQVGDQVRDQVGDQVVDQVWDQVRDQVGAQVGAQVVDQVWDQAWDQVGAQVGDQVRDQVVDQVGAQVRDQVWAQVGAQVWAQVGAQVGAQVYKAFYSQHESALFSFYDVFRDIVSDCEKLAGLISLARSSGWCWFFQGAVIFTDRPELVSMDSGRLHNESGPAIRYRDGFSVYAIDGIRLGRQVVMEPATQTIKQINSEQNSDIKAIRIARFGWPRYLKETGAQCIDERSNDIEGTKEALYKSDSGSRFVVTCPTGRVFAMGVPDSARNCEQAAESLSPRKVRILART